MPKTLNDALKEAGLNAKYDGNPARLLPISSSVLNEYPGVRNANIGKPIGAGDMIVTWRAENGKMKGKAIDPLAMNDLGIVVRLSDGGEKVVSAAGVGEVIEQLAGMVKEDRTNRSEIEEDNRKAEKAHAKAIAKGDIDDDEPFTPKKPTYADGEFKNLGHLVSCMKARLSNEYNNDFVGLSGRSEAALGELKLTKATRDVLTAEELAKAHEAETLRNEIRKMAEGAEVAAPVEREHGLERVEELMEDLPITGADLSPAQMAAMMPNSELTTLAFKPLTSTPLSEIQAKVLSPRDVNSLLQEMAPYEDTDWAPAAIEKTRALLTDRMANYTFNAKIFSRDGVDVMLVSDHAAAVLYSWDVETRVPNYDTRADLKVYQLSDVPTDEELEDLRNTVRDMRYDVGNDEIDFSLDDEVEEVIMELDN
jgi:hypothetical protein